ncbi:hypothetical protein [Nocardioides hungaricus]
MAGLAGDPAQRDAGQPHDGEEGDDHADREDRHRDPGGTPTRA